MSALRKQEHFVRSRLELVYFVAMLLCCRSPNGIAQTTQFVRTRLLHIEDCLMPEDES
jgi:hypothetical protein